MDEEKTLKSTNKSILYPAVPILMRHRNICVYAMVLEMDVQPIS